MAGDRVIRVLVADDEELIRVALASLLDLEDDIEVVAHAADGRDAIEQARRHRPDVAVIDLEMPKLGGLEAATELVRARPSCAVIILTGRGRPVHVRAALDAGARAFMVKGAPATALADVVRRVHDGQRYVDPALAADALSAPPSPLTERELEALRLTEVGFDNAAIAMRLHLARGTVRNLLSTIRVKLDVDTTTAAVRMARDSGWMP